MNRRADLIYLDYAATSWPKPPTVQRAMCQALEEAGGNPGRSAHPLAMRAAETVADCREALAGFFGLGEEERVVFTMNTTYALNLAIKGLLHRGDHVLLSNLEHNAVRRPLEKLRSMGEISFDLFDARGSEAETLASLAAMETPRTRAVVCIHASNICGKVLPLDAISRFCRTRNLLLIVDAAQSAGHLPLDLGKIKADAVALPGHKGLYGPQGVGVLLLREGVLPETILEGGTGVHSLEAPMPDFLPERLEAGTLPVPAIAGLGAAVRWLGQITPAAVAEKETFLAGMLAERFLNDASLCVYGSTAGSVLSVNLRGVPAQEVGRRLGAAGVCVRTGFHCAPLAHRTLETGVDGSVRFSTGYFNSEADIKKVDRIFTRIERDLLM